MEIINDLCLDPRSANYRVASSSQLTFFFFFACGITSCTCYCKIKIEKECLEKNWCLESADSRKVWPCTGPLTLSGFVKTFLVSPARSEPSEGTVWGADDNQPALFSWCKIQWFSLPLAHELKKEVTLLPPLALPPSQHCWVNAHCLKGLQITGKTGTKCGCLGSRAGWWNHSLNWNVLNMGWLDSV